MTKATYVYKILNDICAPNLKDSLISRNSLKTSYNLRNSHIDLALPKPRCEFLKKSFKYSAGKLWNNLPREAREAQSIFSFKSILLQINCY